jgi:hypothetical protein
MPVEWHDGEGITDCPRCNGRIVIELADGNVYLKEGKGLQDLAVDFLNAVFGPRLD